MKISKDTISISIFDESPDSSFPKVGPDPNVARGMISRSFLKRRRHWHRTFRRKVYRVRTMFTHRSIENSPIAGKDRGQGPTEKCVRANCKKLSLHPQDILPRRNLIRERETRKRYAYFLYFIYPSIFFYILFLPQTEEIKDFKLKKNWRKFFF